MIEEKNALEKKYGISSSQTELKGNIEPIKENNPTINSKMEIELEIEKKPKPEEKNVGFLESENEKKIPSMLKIENEITENSQKAIQEELKKKDSMILEKEGIVPSLENIIEIKEEKMEENIIPEKIETRKKWADQNPKMDIEPKIEINLPLRQAYALCINDVIDKQYILTSKAFMQVIFEKYDYFSILLFFKRYILYFFKVFY